jgi:branched-chain amino acid transport system substrate-binding protein
VAFVWDRTPAVKAWSLAFKQRIGRVPSFTQAGTYSAIRHWLMAVRDTGTSDADKVLARMKAMPVDDIFASNGHIREDGVMVHDWYLRQVKSPSESTGPDDLFKTLATIPGDQVVRPLSESQCPLVKKS